MSCVEGQEGLVKESLLAFLKEHIPKSDLSHVDEIVLSYVASILEELGSDAGQEDIFDVESFSEMLTAYFPDFASISHTAICDWIFELSAQLSKLKQDSKESRNNLDGLKFPAPVVTKPERLSPRVSESSDVSAASDSSHSSIQDFEKTDDARLLLEMFPTISLVEATHCLSLSNGSMDEAVQLVLHRQETGESFTNTLDHSPSLHKNRPVNDHTLKQKIIEKYSYIDKDDDQREHRPPPLKQQPKKMIRYLDNKVVTMKGERFTEIKDETETSKEDAKKTFVALKPARQYRFH